MILQADKENSPITYIKVLKIFKMEVIIMDKKRLNKVLNEMGNSGIEQMIISDPVNIFYLTGKWIFPGERMLVLYIKLGESVKLFVNELFPISEELGTENIMLNDSQDPVEVLAKYIDKNRVIGIDKNWPSRFLIRLMEITGVNKFINISKIIDKVRMRKDMHEIELMRESSRVNDIAVGKMIELIPNKYTEKKMGQMLKEIYEEQGAEDFSFEPIVAYGANGADPHHTTDDISVLKEGDSIVIDIGCKKNSYCSDITRTVFYKHVSDMQKKVYQIVLEANLRAIDKVKPGARFCDIDFAAREYIEDAGFGKYFTHRTGHSIGLEDHEFGDVSSVNTDTIDEGMIFSVEPGIYLPGDFGVRIEDLVLVTKEGCEVLNKYSKDLHVVE